MASRWSRVRWGILAGVTLGMSLACGGITDPDRRVCTWRSDQMCAEHFAERFGEQGLEPERRELGRSLVSAACGRGNATACLVYGQEIGFERPGFSARRADAAEALSTACDKGEPEGCFQLARVWTAPGEGRDPARAVPVYQAQCESPGGSMACNNLGLLYENGDGVERNPATAVELYARSCASDNEIGCFNQARAVERGIGGPPDPARARELFEPLCKDDPLESCHWLSRLLRNPAAGTPDPERAAALAKSSCQKGYPPACVTVGYDLFEGRGVPADPPAALKVWNDACDRGNGQACNASGIALGNADDEAGARARFDRGCQLEDASACFNLSGMQDGDPGLLERSCRLGSAMGCNDLGVHFANQGNHASAREVYGIACRNGDDLGCKNLGGSLERVEPKDFEAAFNAYMVGCERGNAELCRFAGSMLKDRGKARELFGRACQLGDARGCRLAR